MRAEPNTGLSLKTFTASYLEANLEEVSLLSANLQLRLHEFRNALDALNQEILLARDMHMLTWDQSIVGANKERLNDDVNMRYAKLQDMSRTASDKLAAFLLCARNGHDTA